MKIMRYFPIFIMALLPYLNTSILHAHIYDPLGASILQVAQFSGIQATVSSQSSDNAEFSTLELAIAAGHNAIRVIGDTTETAVTTLIKDLDYLISIDSNVSLDFVDNNLLYAATSSDLGFEQKLAFIGQGKIVYAFTTVGNRLFKQNGLNNILAIAGLTIMNDSTADDCSVSDARVFMMEHIAFDLPFQDKGGIVSSSDSRNRVSNIIFFGGSAPTSRALVIDGDGIYTNISFTGAFLGTAPILEVITSATSITNLNFNAAFVFSGAVIANVQGILDKILAEGSIDLILNVKGDGTIISNMNALNTVIDIATFSNCILSNVFLEDTASAIDLSDVSASNNSLSNIKTVNLSTIAGDQNKLQNVEIEASANVTISGDDNGLTNCQVGTVAGGSAAAIIVSASADQTRIANCLLDNSITDSGTNTALANNTIY